MSASRESIERLELSAQVLARCTVFGFALLFLWTGMLMAAPGVVQQLHGRLFDLTSHELWVIHYCGIAFLKICVLLFFFFPWVATRWVLRRNRS